VAPKALPRRLVKRPRQEPAAAEIACGFKGLDGSCARPRGVAVERSSPSAAERQRRIEEVRGGWRMQEGCQRDRGWQRRTEDCRGGPHQDPPSRFEAAPSAVDDVVWRCRGRSLFASASVEHAHACTASPALCYLCRWPHACTYGFGPTSLRRASVCRRAAYIRSVVLDATVCRRLPIHMQIAPTIVSVTALCWTLCHVYSCREMVRTVGVTQIVIPTVTIVNVKRLFSIPLSLERGKGQEQGREGQALHVGPPKR
jgi:hypothetical protein